MRIKPHNQVHEKRNPRTKVTVNQLLDRYLVEAELEFSTRYNYVSYSTKHIRPLLGETKVGALDAGVTDSLYAELRWFRDHCKKTGTRPKSGRCNPYTTICHQSTADSY